MGKAMSDGSTFRQCHFISFCCQYTYLSPALMLIDSSIHKISGSSSPQNKGITFWNVDNKRELIFRKHFFSTWDLYNQLLKTNKECLTLAQPLPFHLKLCKCMCECVCVYVYVVVHRLTCVCTMYMYISLCMCIICICMYAHLCVCYQMMSEHFFYEYNILSAFSLRKKIFLISIHVNIVY